MNKKCTKCFETKPKTEYAKHIRYRDGFLSWCKSCVSENKKRWKKANKEHVQEKNRIYMKSEERKKWRSHYRKTTPHARLEDRFRLRIRCFLKSSGLQNKTSAKILLGCSWKELRDHLETQFQPGMNWENHGRWHVDHIIPMAFYKGNLAASCHYFNLQPLWAEENYLKSDKY